MSQPKRYNIIWTVKAEDPEMGVWVEWDDYAALAAENATNDAEFCEMKQDYMQLRIKNAALAAENERLRKVGFRLAERLSWCGNLGDKPLIKEWQELTGTDVYKDDHEGDAK